jgi:nucleotide-binding universal stress UspA family protein
MSEHERPYTVVVGVSDTSKSATALTWGKALADANGGRLIAVRVHPGPHAPDAAPESPRRGAEEAERMREEQRAELARDVAEVLGDDHGAEIRIIHGSKRRGLINESHEADVLIIDAPRAPSMSPLLAQRIVYAATCPVVVMPPSISGLPESALTRSARAVGRAALRSAGTSGRAGYRPPYNPEGDT